MGLVGVQENGNGEMGLSSLPLGSKNKYRRMNSELREDYDDASRQKHQEDRNNSTRKYVLACAVFASLNSVLLGYDVGVMSGAIIFIQEDLKITEVQEEVLVGILSIVSLFGSLAGGRTSDAIGRKWTMALAAVIFQIGAVIMTLSPSFEVLMIGRLLAGIGIGFGVMIAPVYIAEISPAIARGSLTSFPEVFINFGILLGYVSNYAFSGLPAHINWRIMLAVGILPSVFIGFALFVIPESPRWLVIQNRVEEARSVLQKTNDSEKEVEERLAEIQVAAGTADVENHEEKAVWRELLSPSPSVCRMLVTGFGIQCFQQITGIDATVYYSPEIFKDAGVEGNTNLLAATVAVGVTKTAFILVAIFLIDKLGRKPLLYVSTIGMTICLFSLGLSLSLLGQGQVGIALSILSVCGNVAFFSVGIGPICWVLTTEIFPLRLRSQAAALGAVGNRVCSGLVAMSFLSVSRAISVAGVFFIFSAISALAVLFVYTFVPETKGKSLEQIELLFKDKHEWHGSEVEMGDVENLVQKEQGSEVEMGDAENLVQKE
ncbi:putative polyol transporter 4 [Castanea sativa]|uniref:putative polyol transporter 4 n=1 Tax=Castanea sativa TaxID=21020 RepID=UPI003F64F72E